MIREYKLSGFILIIFFLCLSLFSQAPNKAGGNEFSSMIIDAHMHSGLKIIGGRPAFYQLDYFTGRGMNGFFIGMPVDRSKTSDLPARITNEVEQIKKITADSQRTILIQADWRPDKFPADDKIRLFLGIEYFDGVFNNNLNSVQKYKKLGIKYITLMDNADDRLFSGNEKLNKFGMNIIKEMNGAGILIDISHLNKQQRLSVISYSKAPVIASHSNTIKHAAVPGNLTDKVLYALKEKGGYVFLTFNKEDIYRDADPGSSAFDQLIKHMDHLKNNIGADHFGIGSDYQASGRYIPAEFNRPDVFVRLKQRMLESGYTQNEIENIFARNLLHALETAAH